MRRRDDGMPELLTIHLHNGLVDSIESSGHERIACRILDYDWAKTGDVEDYPVVDVDGSKAVEYAVTAIPRQPMCGDADCPGYAVFNEGEDFELGELQRCDACDRYEDDDDAADAARAAGWGIKLSPCHRGGEAYEVLSIGGNDG